MYDQHPVLSSSINPAFVAATGPSRTCLLSASAAASVAERYRASAPPQGPDLPAAHARQTISTRSLEARATQQSKARPDAMGSAHRTAVPERPTSPSPPCAPPTSSARSSPPHSSFLHRIVPTRAARTLPRRLSTTPRLVRVFAPYPAILCPHRRARLHRAQRGARL
jgi:hypothetical protein